MGTREREKERERARAHIFIKRKQFSQKLQTPEYCQNCVRKIVQNWGKNLWFLGEDLLPVKKRNYRMDAETIEGHHSVWSLCQKTRQAKGASRRITGGDGGEGRQEARWREERGFRDWTRARLAVLGLQPLPALALHQQLEVWNLVYKGRDETRRRRSLASNPDTLFLPRAHHPDESDGQLFQLCLLFIFSFLPSFLAHLPFLADFFFLSFS